MPLPTCENRFDQHSLFDALSAARIRLEKEEHAMLPVKQPQSPAV